MPTNTYTRIAVLASAAMLSVGHWTNAPTAPAGNHRLNATSTPAARSSSQSLPAGTSQYTKVMIIAEENHTYGQIIGAPQAPYLNHLATQYGSASAMDARYPTTCPSLAAYILMTSGTTHGICDDQGPRHHPLAGDNIFAQITAAALTWRGYAEDEPTPCARHNSPDGTFLVRHTPAAYYLTEQTRCRTAQIAAGTPQHGALHDDVSRGTLPAYAYITPNACHDMHGAAGCPKGDIATADTWLATWIPQILAGPDFTRHHLLIIITWDEGNQTSNHIPTVVISATTHHRAPTTAYTHCSTLATVEDTLGLPRLGCARTATTMDTGFGLSPMRSASTTPR